MGGEEVKARIKRNSLISKEIEDKVRNMNREELWRFCHGKICETSNCNNACVRGYVLCVACLHGEAEFASPVYQFAKELFEMLDDRARAAR